MIHHDLKKDNKFLSSINRELHAIMETDQRVVIIGEDILDPYGGAFKVTSGLSSRFSDRIFTTPISESAIIGIAIGMAMRGFYPVVEIMFGDFLTLAADQIINHAAKFRWMYNENVEVPIVVRIPVGGRRGYGPTHSQCLEKHFIGVPGLWIVAPHVAGNPGKLLNQSLFDYRDPVLFIESKTSYGRPLIHHLPGFYREDYSDTSSSFPSTSFFHKSEDGKIQDSQGLLFCYGGMLPLCIEAVEQLRDREGIYINISVLTQLSPIPKTHIGNILARNQPNLCIYAEEANPEGGWASELIATIEEIRGRQNESVAIRHIRIGSKATPVPASKALELRTLPQVDDITETILNCL